MKVNLTTIYETLLDVRDKVSTMSGSVELTVEQGKDHERRLRALERRVWALPSFAVLVSITGVLIEIWTVTKK